MSPESVSAASKNETAYVYPTAIIIKAGTTVVWSNKLSSVPHTVLEGVPSHVLHDFGNPTKLLVPGSSDTY